jgi:hypothetical protein
VRSLQNKLFRQPHLASTQTQQKTCPVTPPKGIIAPDEAEVKQEYVELH